MKRVIIESPYKGDIERNLRFARAAMLDSILWGESPFASHLLYPQILNEDVEAERELGMRMGWDWMRSVDRVVVYDNFGVTEGMARGMALAEHTGIEILRRTLKDF